MTLNFLKAFISHEQLGEDYITRERPLLIRYSRDYGYMDDRGMGIRKKVIPLMIKDNKSEPDFEITEDYFKVILKKRH